MGVQETLSVVEGTHTWACCVGWPAVSGAGPETVVCGDKTGGCQQSSKEGTKWEMHRGENGGKQANRKK